MTKQTLNMELELTSSNTDVDDLELIVSILNRNEQLLIDYPSIEDAFRLIRRAYNSINEENSL